MAIKNDQIDFLYAPDGAKENTFRISYFLDSGTLTFLHLKNQEQMSFPLDLFKDLMKFLVSNRFVKSDEVNSISSVNQNFPMGSIVGAEQENIEDNDALEEDFEDWGVSDAEDSTGADEDDSNSGSEDLTDEFFKGLSSFEISELPNIPGIEAEGSNEKFKSANKKEFSRRKPQPLPDDPDAAMARIQEERQLNKLASGKGTIKRLS